MHLVFVRCSSGAARADDFGKAVGLCDSGTAVAVERGRKVSGEIFF